MRLGRLPGRLGDAEVDDLDLAFIAHQHVLWADVAMDDVEGVAQGVGLVVGVVEAFAHLHRDIAGHIDADLLAEASVAFEQAAAVEPGDVLHGDEVAAIRFAEIENLSDVGVVQPPGDLGLVDEHRDELGVLGDCTQDPFDRQQALESLDTEGLGLEHLSHAAGGYLFEQVVLSERHGDRKDPVILGLITGPTGSR